MLEVMLARRQPRLARALAEARLSVTLISLQWHLCLYVIGRARASLTTLSVVCSAQAVLLLVGCSPRLSVTRGLLLCAVLCCAVLCCLLRPDT